MLCMKLRINCECEMYIAKSTKLSNDLETPVYMKRQTISVNLMEDTIHVN